MKSIQKFTIVLSIFALLAFFGYGCSGGSGSHHAPATPRDPPPEPIPNTEVTGYWHVEMGRDGSAPLTLSITSECCDERGAKLIIEFQIPEQDEDGVFSYTGPVSIMGLYEVESTIEGKVDGNSVTFTITVEGFVLSFEGTVEDGIVIGTWSSEGTGPVIVIEGLEMRVLPEAELSGTFNAVIAEAQHTPPTLAGNWEVLDITIDEDTCSISGYILGYPYELIDVFQEGWVFGASFFSVEFYGVVYLDGTVILLGCDYYLDIFFEFEGTLEDNIFTGTFEIQGEECITTGSITFQVHPEGYVIEGYTIEGDLNINPSKSSSKRFEMETPFGWIDIDTLKEQGVNYTYMGPASEIRIKVKNQGRTLIVDGEEVQLSTKKRYTITSPAMMVYLRNTKYNPDAISPQCSDKHGYWWIQIKAVGVDIEPDPVE